MSRFARFVAIGLFVVSLAWVGLAAFVPSLVNEEELRAKMLSEINQLTSGTVAIDGKFKISIFPVLQATISDVTASHASGAFALTAMSIEASVSPLSALMGRIELSSVALNDADITVRAQDSASLGDLWKSTPLGIAISTAEKRVKFNLDNPDLASLGNIKFGTVTLSQTNLTVVDLQGNQHVASNINGELSWPSLQTKAALQVDAFWRGEKVNVVAHVAKPLALIAQGNSEFDIQIESFPLNASYKGSGRFGTDVYAHGAVSLKTPSMLNFLKWMDVESYSGKSLGKVEFNANLSGKDGKWQFADLMVSIADQVGYGVMRVRPFDAPPRAGGSLAFESVDLAKLASSLPLGVEQWGGGALPKADEIAMDFRISAENATVGKYVITNVGGAVRLEQGNAYIDLATGNVGGGTVSGRLVIAGPSDQRNGHLEVAVKEFQQDQIGTGASDFPLFTGPLNGKFELDGPYKSFKSFIANGKGRFDLVMGEGTLHNFSVASFCTTLEETESFDLQNLFSGISESEKLSLRSLIKNGNLEIETLDSTIGGHHLFLSGRMPLLSDELNLSGYIVDVVPATAAQSTAFSIQGTWQNPIVKSRVPDDLIQ